MKATQTLMPFFEPLSEGAAFAAYKQRHPEVKAALIAAARHAKERLGVFTASLARCSASRVPVTGFPPTLARSRRSFTARASRSKPGRVVTTHE